MCVSGWLAILFNVWYIRFNVPTRKCTVYANVALPLYYFHPVWPREMSCRMSHLVNDCMAFVKPIKIVVWRFSGTTIMSSKNNRGISNTMLTCLLWFCSCGIILRCRSSKQTGAFRFPLHEVFSPVEETPFSVEESVLGFISFCHSWIKTVVSWTKPHCSNCHWFFQHDFCVTVCYVEVVACLMRSRKWIGTHSRALFDSRSLLAAAAWCV